MVHPGGIMAGVQGCGALAALQSMGLTNVFDEIYTISAGFPNVSYFLAEQAETSISVYCENLSGRKFINPLKFWRVENVDYLLSVFEKSNRKLLYEKIAKCGTKLYVFVKNIDTGDTNCIQIPRSDRKRFFSLLRAAVSVPFLSPRPIRIGKFRYQDVIMNFEKQRQILFNKVAALNPTDLLAIYNYPVTHTMEMENVNVLEIAPQKDWLDSPYRTDTKILKLAAENMRTLTKSIFETATNTGRFNLLTDA